MIKKLERRIFHAEVRVVDQEGPKIIGYSAVFNQLSVDLGGFREKINPGTFAQTIMEDDIRALFNHDENYVIGRNTNGTLTLSEDEHGLSSIIIPEDTYIDQYLIKKIKRGDIDGMSFGFTVPEGGDEWDMSDPQNPIRILLRVKLWDVSPVAFPAYPQTEVGVRTAQDVFNDFISESQVSKLIEDERKARTQERILRERERKIETLVLGG
jgi:hypothetical protein